MQKARENQPNGYTLANRLVQQRHFVIKVLQPISKNKKTNIKPLINKQLYSWQYNC